MRFSLAILSMVLASCHAGEAPHQKMPVAVKVQAVSAAPPVRGTPYSATIHPATTVDCAFRVGGYVEQIAQVKGIDGRMRLLQEGDRVVHGLQLAAVRKADYEQKLAESRAALAEAKAQAEQAQMDFDRGTKLARNQAISAAELDSARVKLQATTARVDGAAVRLQEAETALADTHVRAPLQGVVLRRGVEIGALAGPGTVAFSLADLDTVKVVFGVPDTVVQTLRLGSVQTISTEAFRNKEFEGHITRIAPSADLKSRVFEVEVSLPNDEHELKAGMIAMLKLGGPETVAPAAAVVPLSAVVRDTADRNKFAVYVVDEAQKPPAVRLRTVELGDFLGNLIPIKDGVKSGEKVVVLGAALLTDGDAVQIIP